MVSEVERGSAIPYRPSITWVNYSSISCIIVCVLFGRSHGPRLAFLHGLYQIKHAMHQNLVIMNRNPHYKRQLETAFSMVERVLAVKSCTGDIIFNSNII